MDLLKEVEKHEFSNGSYGRITKFTTAYLGIKGFNYSKFGGSIEVPILKSSLTENEAFSLLADDVKADVLELEIV